MEAFRFSREPIGAHVQKTLYMTPAPQNTPFQKEFFNFSKIRKQEIENIKINYKNAT